MSSDVSSQSITICEQASRKLALVIGNNTYQHGSKLNYSINDAQDIAHELEQMNFQVTMGIDLSYVSMIQMILRFQRQINPNDLVVFFYSGHGTQWEDQNYLIAIDNKCLADDTEMYRYHAIRVQLILESMAKRRPSAVIFLLDCCRTYLIENQALSNTPMTKSIQENTTTTGLAPMKGVAGSLIVFACGPNEVVLDESKNGRNSVFTHYLLKHMAKPNLKIDELLCHVCNDIFEDTKEQSCCYRLSSLRTPNVYLNAMIEGQNCVLLQLPYRNDKLQKQIDECDLRSVINLHELNLKDEDMDIVAEQAIVRKQCKYIRLSNNQITSYGASMIASVLKNFTNLEALILCNNTIADSGVSFLSNKLAMNNSRLKVLILGSNQITDVGAEYLAKMLETNQTLVFLGLSFNEISDQGMQSLSNALTLHNRTLKELYLNGNRLIGDSSVDSLILMLRSNRTLKKFQMDDCNLSKKNKRKVRAVVRWRFFFSIKL